MPTDETKDEALARLAERKANAPEPIRNQDLYAGSPMYFYCRICGELTDTLPEGYLGRPKKLCDECADLIDKGWL